VSDANEEGGGGSAGFKCDPVSRTLPASGIQILHPGEVHVWFAVPEELPRESLREIEGWLSPDEQLRCSRFQQMADRRRNLVGRALIRSVLSSYLQTDPKSLRFVENEFGRPELEPSAAYPRLRFNLSKTSGMVACCVARNHEVGLDVEDLRRSVDVTPLATRFFAPAETRDLLALPEHARRQRFFEYWTLKEAYVKALGAGLTIPLNQFWFQLDLAPIRLALQSPSSDDPADWQFEHITPAEQHLIAVAIRRQGADLPLIVRRWAP